MSLPIGSVFVARHQVAGRGRGKNGWISQQGCLQFSVKIVHLNVKTAIFIQYLFGLAVVEAIKSCSSDIPVFLKWPNDIYAKLQGDLIKIGGILITTEFQAGRLLVTIGCGLNVSNPKPSICLNAFASVEYHLEPLLARILSIFESVYLEFVRYSENVSEADPFNPFLQRYYANWLHTYLNLN